MDFNSIAAECAPWVAPQTLAAIVRTESQFRTFAIGVNGGAKLARQPITKEEAVVTAKWLIANNYNIDMGLGQVNSANLAKTGLSVEEAFDPCKNLAAAGKILTWNYQSASKKIPNQQAALHAAISAYNTGSFTRGFNNGYVQKVLNNANVIQGTNFTPVGLTLIKPIAVTAPVNKAALFNLAKNGAAEKKPAKKNTGVNKPENTTNPNEQTLINTDQSAAIDHGIMVYAD